MSLAINISFEIPNFHTNSNCITIFHKYCPNFYFILSLHFFSYLILILILLVLFEFDLFTMYRVTSLKSSIYVSDTLLLFLYFVHRFESKVNFLLLFRKFRKIFFIYLSLHDSLPKLCNILQICHEQTSYFLSSYFLSIYFMILRFFF